MLKVGVKKTIVLGIGNSGRQDDGLGWLFLDEIVKLDLTDHDFEYRYQLQIEDAELISHYDKVIFVDATKEQTAKGYALKTCIATDKYSFSTHELVPETVLYLTNRLYKKFPDAEILAIQGYEWNLKTGLSMKATVNLQKALLNISETIVFEPDKSQ